MFLKTQSRTVQVQVFPFLCAQPKLFTLFFHVLSRPSYYQCYLLTMHLYFSDMFGLDFVCVCVWVHCPVLPVLHTTNQKNCASIVSFCLPTVGKSLKYNDKCLFRLFFLWSKTLEEKGMKKKQKT